MNFTILGIFLFLSLSGTNKPIPSPFSQKEIKIDNISLQVQIADSKPKRTQGLMFQNALTLNKGMLFIYEKMGKHHLWMLNMKFSLDMIWFDKEGKIVQMEENMPPCKASFKKYSCPVIKNKKESLYTLEVKSGFIKQNNITKKSILKLSSFL